MSLRQRELFPSFLIEHFELNFDRIRWLKRGIEWKNKKINELRLDPANPILLARTIDPEVIASCEEVKEHLQTQHEEIMRVTLPELNIAETNALSENSGTALVSESNFEILKLSKQ